MKPMDRSGDIPLSTDHALVTSNASRESVAVCLPVVDAWIAMALALLAALSFTRCYGSLTDWRDPSNGHRLTFLEAVRLACKDAHTSAQLALVEALEAVERTLLIVDGWTPIATPRGTEWIALGATEHRSQREAVADAFERSLLSPAAREKGFEGLREGITAYRRERNDQRADEAQQQRPPEEAQQPPPAIEEDPPLAAWMERPRGMEGTLQRVGLPPPSYGGLSGIHTSDVALDDEGGVPG